MRVIPRTEAGLLPPARPHAAQALPVPRVWLHHSAGNEGELAEIQAIQRDHLRRGWRDIAYNFPVTVAGKVVEGVGLFRHLNSDAGASLTILLVGNFDVRPVPEPMLDAAAWLLAHGLLAGWWADQIRPGMPHLTGGHRDIPGAKPTACPGRFAHAAIPEINARAARIIHSLSDTEDDMAAADLHRFFARPDGTIPATWHSGAEALLTLNHNVGVLLSRQATQSRDITALAAAVGTAATPDEVLGIIQAALEPLVEAIDGIDVTGTPGDASTVWQIIRDLADAQLAG